MRIAFYLVPRESPCLVAHKREETSRSFAERAVGIAPSRVTFGLFAPLFKGGWGDSYQCRY
jgi:hypothetical protein